MNFKRLFSDEKGVTPVIGVMLMIVVTVILAAAVSSYAGSIESQEAAPQATFAVSCDESSNAVTIEALGGDTIYKNNLKIEIESSFPAITGYVNMSEVSFSPNADYLRPGDVGTIAVGDGYNPTTYATESGWGVKFAGDEISQTVNIGDSFKCTLIDTDSGQTIFSTNVVVNP
ncbi:type IV pilin [Methanococcoides methylutens]|uniref:Archaeal Type IV pilin N-terminal domain-containing protein n=1 Tax=Methanococcoides methylutens MM1 TaxID=1434104 RepID=A0A0E3SS12_METMT|nr:type IV pilin N-terminal domain-containing protein [Methanococcoides methylutens]AKB85871.1 hypothetical protein MCMEM_1818 [Methanococcoides methylutens MM1]